jgi:hypothetical protein
MIIFKYNKNDYSMQKISSCTITGTAKDVSKYLPIITKKIEMISNCFLKSNIIIFENDSIDDTLLYLNKWKEKSNFNIKIISEKNLQGKRTQRLAYARNKLLSQALKNNNEYMVVVDMDNINLDLTREGFLSCFKYKNDWAVLGANQKKIYQDSWALRTFDDWMPFDCWDCVHIEKKGEEYCWKSRFRNIKPTNKLIEVKSCFGGLAVYKTKYLKNCSYYGGEINGHQVCEHVKFNKDIREKNNGKIFINPQMINS